VDESIPLFQRWSRNPAATRAIGSPAGAIGPRRRTLRLSQLAGRRWFRFPEGTDPLWQAYWNGSAPGGSLRDGPVVRTVSECLQAVLWNGTIGLAPLGYQLPEGLVAVPVPDMPPSRLVVAWREGDANPLVRSFADITADSYRLLARSGKQHAWPAQPMRASSAVTEIPPDAG